MLPIPKRFHQLKLSLFFSPRAPKAAEVQPKDQLTASYLKNHVSQATWKSYVVECKEDYDLLYHAVREECKIPINIIIVDKVETPQRLYSQERFELLCTEYGF